jgi:hypothetical protein
MGANLLSWLQNVYIRLFWSKIKYGRNLIISVASRLVSPLPVSKRIADHDGARCDRCTSRRAARARSPFGTDQGRARFAPIDPAATSCFHEQSTNDGDRMTRTGSVALQGVRIGDRRRIARGWLVVADGAIRGILSAGTDGEVLFGFACDRRVTPEDGLMA